MATVAFIIGDMVEDSEFEVPYRKLRDSGHQVMVIGQERGTVTGKQGGTFTTEFSAQEITPEDVDALVIPGGYSPDKLRTDPQIVELTRQITRAGKPVAAVCHGPWLLVEADVLRGRQVTSYPSVRTDLINAGARWTDAAVVEDGNLITSRGPSDLDAFTDTLLQRLTTVPAHH